MARRVRAGNVIYASSWRTGAMGWTLFFMMVILKIPLLAALYLVWYAIRDEPAEADEGPAADERKPWRKPPPLPGSPRRRGPAGGAGCWPAPCPQTVERVAGRPAPAVTRRG